MKIKIKHIYSTDFILWPIPFLVIFISIIILIIFTINKIDRNLYLDLFSPFNYFNAGATDYVKEKLGINIKIQNNPIWEKENTTTIYIPEQYEDRKSDIIKTIEEYKLIYNHRIINTQEIVQANIVRLVERNRHGYLGRFETRKYEIEYKGLKGYYIEEARSEILANAGGDRPLESGEKVWARLVTEKYNDTGEIVNQYLR